MSHDAGFPSDPDVHNESPSRPPLARAILWIALIALLVAGLASGLHIKACVGSCCAVAAIDSCDAPATDARTHRTESGGCCCCADASDERRDGAPDPDQVRGACSPGCCITIAFDTELAPCDVPRAEMPFAAIAAGDDVAPAFGRDPEPLVRLRPFDRGPPRIDARTRLRASTVLLI